MPFRYLPTSILASPGKFLLAILATALVTRLLFFVIVACSADDASVFHFPDTDSYVRPATSLLDSGVFENEHGPELFRTPGYPLFLMPGILIGHVEYVTVVLQILLSVLTVYIVYRLALLVSDREEVALTAGLLYAVEPLSIIFSVTLLTETLLALFLTASVLFLCRYLTRPRTSELVIAALLISAATYVRPLSYYYPLAVSASLLIMALMAESGKRRRVYDTAIFLSLSLVAVGAWQVRNAAVADYTGFSSVKDAHLYYSEGLSVVAALEGTPHSQLLREEGYYGLDDLLSAHPEMRDMTQGERLRTLRAMGMDIIVNHPATLATVRAGGALRILLDPGTGSARKLFADPATDGPIGFNSRVMSDGLPSAIGYLMRNYGGVVVWTLVLGLLLASTYVLVAAASLSRWFVLDSRMVVIVGTALYLLVLSACVFAVARFRHPMMPLVCTIAAFGVGELKRRWRERRSN